MKLLIVGQAPSRSMEPDDKPLWNTTALTMIAKYGGLADKYRVYELAELTNMIQEYPGPQLGNEKYDAYPKTQAMHELRERVLPWVKARQSEETTVVFLGSAVRDTVARWTVLRDTELHGVVRKPAWFDEYMITGVEARVFFSPHPGGTSMWWNDPKNRQRGSLFWRNAFSTADSSKRTTDTLPEQSDRRVEMYNAPRG